MKLLTRPKQDEIDILARINRGQAITEIASLRLINEACAPLSAVLSVVNQVGRKIAKDCPWEVAGHA